MGLQEEIRFAHLSDWHATSLVGGGASLWRGKRISGWASWGLNRRRHHDPRILEAAIRDVHAQNVDRVLVTGDLTHVALEQEFRVAAKQLESLGRPEDVFLIPGNHDCYVPAPPEKSWDLWADYLRADTADVLGPDLAECLAVQPEVGRAPRHEDYPTLRVSGRLAAIGLCSAIPTPIFRAGGLLGERQMRRLEELLTRLGERGLCRVIMIHHPIAADGEPQRRALWDGQALRDLLGRVGAELVIHGHKHRRRIRSVPGPEAEIPVVGVPSSSEVGSRPDKRAQYHLYRVSASPDPARRHRIEAEVRGYDSSSGEFVSVEADLLGDFQA